MGPSGDDSELRDEIRNLLRKVVAMGIPQNDLQDMLIDETERFQSAREPSTIRDVAGTDDDAPKPSPGPHTKTTNSLDRADTQRGDLLAHQATVAGHGERWVFGQGETVVGERPATKIGLKRTIPIGLKNRGPLPFGEASALVENGYASLATSLSKKKDPELRQRYEDMALIGEGGMAEVRRVLDRDLNRAVAMKIVKLPFLSDIEMMTRFVIEAQVTARLQHPNILPVYDFGFLDDQRFYFTMREVRGHTLQDVIREVHRASSGGQWQPSDSGWNFRRLVAAFRSVCDAVAYAHGVGVIHRDIKPVNVMVGDYGEVQVFDWGVAKLVDAVETSTDEVPSPDAYAEMNTLAGTIMGTIGYMAPEQATGEVDRIGPPTDVYALGATLYEILTCDRPFRHRGRQLLDDFASETPPVLQWPEDIPPNPDDLREICEKAMSHKEADRFEHAGSLATRIGEWLDGAHQRDKALTLVSTAARKEENAKSMEQAACELTQRAETENPGSDLNLPREARERRWALEDRTKALNLEAHIKHVEANQLLTGALLHSPSLPEAHTALAQRYLDEHKYAENTGNYYDAIEVEVHLRAHARALPKANPFRLSLEEYLRGVGTISLGSNPTGAEVILYTFEQIHRRLVPVRRHTLGTTPLDRVEVPIGSHLLMIDQAGRHPVCYPVLIERNCHWDGIRPGQTERQEIGLAPRDALSDEDICVPAGWFICGGDDKVSNAPSRRTLWLDAFVIKRDPVIHAQYIDFLNDLVAEGKEDEALRWAPRSRSTGPGDRGALIYLRAEDGQFTINPEGVFVGACPVSHVSWHCAMAYAAWAEEKSGLPWRLPTDMEWEKCARGVDGRIFPWGSFLDPSWACMRNSHMGKPSPAKVSDFPDDKSPYGVRGLAGNLRDWCLDRFEEEFPHSDQSVVVAPGREILTADDESNRVVRGGSWKSFEGNCRSAFRFMASPNFHDDDGSFRLARRALDPADED